MNSGFNANAQEYHPTYLKNPGHNDDYNDDYDDEYYDEEFDNLQDPRVFQ
jgi:hypothetical protein